MRHLHLRHVRNTQKGERNTQKGEKSSKETPKGEVYNTKKGVDNFLMLKETPKREYEFRFKVIKNTQKGADNF